MSFNQESLVDHITDNLRTADYADYECEVENWEVDWSGYNQLELTVEAGAICVNEINGYSLSDVYVFTRSQLEHVLSDYQPETKEEECITADDIRSALVDMRILDDSLVHMKEVPHDLFIQRVLERATHRKSVCY